MKLNCIKTVEEFENKLSGETHGVYNLKFEDERMTFVRNGNTIYKLSHGIDRPRLDIIRDEIRDLFLSKIEGDE